MDYKKALRLHFVNKLSGKDVAANCGCSKSTANEFLHRFKNCPELSYPLKEDVTNEYIEKLLYKKPGPTEMSELYRSFNEEAVYKALSHKGETLKHLWQSYNAVGIVDGKKPMSYRKYCEVYHDWTEARHVTFHIRHYPGINMELDYAGMTLLLHDRKDPVLASGEINHYGLTGNNHSGAHGSNQAENLALNEVQWIFCRMKISTCLALV